MNPSNPDIWCSLGTQLKDNGVASLKIEGAKSVAGRLLDESLDFFDKGLEVDSFHTRSLVNKGSAIEARAPGSEDAITLYERALGLAHACTGDTMMMMMISVELNRGSAAFEPMYHFRKKEWSPLSRSQQERQITWAALATTVSLRPGTTWATHT